MSSNNSQFSILNSQFYLILHFEFCILHSVMGGFRFKQFEVEQSGVAMKVGTDGVLLGAWLHPTRECACK